MDYHNAPYTRRVIFIDPKPEELCGCVYPHEGYCKNRPAAAPSSRNDMPRSGMHFTCNFPDYSSGVAFDTQDSPRNVRNYSPARGDPTNSTEPQYDTETPSVPMNCHGRQQSHTTPSSHWNAFYQNSDQDHTRKSEYRILGPLHRLTGLYQEYVDLTPQREIDFGLCGLASSELKDIITSIKHAESLIDNNPDPEDPGTYQDLNLKADLWHHAWCMTVIDSYTDERSDKLTAHKTQIFDKIAALCGLQQEYLTNTRAKVTSMNCTQLFEKTRTLIETSSFYKNGWPQGNDLLKVVEVGISLAREGFYQADKWPNAATRSKYYHKQLCNNKGLNNFIEEGRAWNYAQGNTNHTVEDNALNEWLDTVLTTLIFQTE